MSNCVWESTGSCTLNPWPCVKTFGQGPNKWYTTYFTTFVHCICIFSVKPNVCWVYTFVAIQIFDDFLMICFHNIILFSSFFINLPIVLSSSFLRLFSNNSFNINDILIMCNIKKNLLSVLTQYVSVPLQHMWKSRNIYTSIKNLIQ